MEEEADGSSGRFSDVTDSEIMDTDVSLGEDEIYQLVQTLVLEAQTVTELNAILDAFHRENNDEVREQAIRLWATTEHAAEHLHLRHIPAAEANLHNNETWLMWLERQCRRYVTPPPTARGDQPPPAPYRSLSALPSMPEEHSAYRSLSVC